MNFKAPRPDIIKLKIEKIGGFLDGMPDKQWAFSGSNHPKSVGNYHSKDWVLIGGYTVEELKIIKLENEYECNSNK
jgi:hypothetical protein